MCDEDREKIFQYFWQTLDWNERKVYVCGFVDCTAVQRCRSENMSPRRTPTLAYHLEVYGEKKRVCEHLLAEWSMLHWVQAKELEETIRLTPVRNEAQNDDTISVRLTDSTITLLHVILL